MLYILKIDLKRNFTVNFMSASSGVRIKVNCWRPWNPLSTDNKITDEDGNIHHDLHSETVVIMTYSSP